MVYLTLLFRENIIMNKFQTENYTALSLNLLHQKNVIQNNQKAVLYITIAYNHRNNQLERYVKTHFH